MKEPIKQIKSKCIIMLRKCYLFYLENLWDTIKTIVLKAIIINCMYKLKECMSVILLLLQITLTCDCIQ